MFGLLFVFVSGFGQFRRKEEGGREGDEQCGQVAVYGVAMAGAGASGLDL